jgi:VanZ family protein
MPRDPLASPPLKAPLPSTGPEPLDWRRLLWDYGPALLVMVVIFVASSDAGSSEQSGRIIGRVLAWLGLMERLTASQIEVIHFTVRKAGHVAEYALLAALLHRAMARGRERWTAPLVLGVLGVVSLYAATDEFHQRFVGSRTASAWDWLLDTVGGGLALAVKGWWERRWRTRSSG